MKVAIVGLACRLPGGVGSLETLWELLAQGRDAVTHIPTHRFDIDAFLHPRRTAPGRSCTFAAGVVDDVEGFDYGFFGISKKEAEYMDPQQRLLLELAWETLEDAQIRPSALAGTDTAVFIGSSSLDASMQRADDPCVIGPYSMIGNTLSLLANRISYLFDIRGPSMSIDTACSSSLVALHQACRSLASGESAMALAGGVHMLLSPLPFVGFSKAHMLSADGRCNVFGADANGYVRAEGGAVLLLMPLSEARRRGLRIQAVIHSTGVNTDGRTIGIAYPNQEAQTALLHSMYAAPDLDPARLCYMEAHGTGTTAGDPVEARSIGLALADLRPGDEPLLVGSIKSNLGHLEPVSGMAGLLKAMLVLQKRMVPPNPGLSALNPDIDFTALHLRPVTELTPLGDRPGPLLAGVSSFGFGGANAHVILEEAPPQAPAPLPAPGPGPLPPLLLSARSQASLAGLARAYAARLDRADPAAYLALAGRTVQCRDQLPHRLVVDGTDPAEVAARLTRFAETGPQRDDPRCLAGEALAGTVKLAFAFSGNGGPWPGMGQAFLSGDADAAAALLRVDAELTPRLGWSVAEVLLGPADAQRLDCIEVVQPLQFAVQVCLTDALAAKGVVPDMVFGHSIGEVAAAYACGALSLADAGRVIVERSILQREAYGLGGMAVAQLTPTEADELPAVRDGELEVAAVNSPRYVTLTGSDAALDALATDLRRRRLVCRRLALRYPFHSRRMDPVRDRLLERLADLQPRPSRIPFLSTVTGAVCPGTDLGATYWWRNIRRPVRFMDAALAALDADARILVELGPDALLAPFLKACREERAATTVSLPSLRKGEQDPDLVRRLWQRIHVHGGQVDVARFFPADPPRVALPAYPWDREVCRVSPTPESLGLFAAKPPAHPLLGRPIRAGLTVWENTLDLDLLPFLADHRLDADVVLPGAGFIEIALAAAREWQGSEGAELENLEFRQPLPLPQGKPRLTRLTITPGGDLRLESRELLHDGPLTLHLLGRVVPRGTSLPAPGPDFPLADPAAFGEELDVAALYEDGREAGLHFGPAFRPMRRLWRGHDASVVRLELDPSATCDRAVLHPSLLDGAFQQLLALVAWEQKCLSPVAYLPMRTGRFVLHRPGRPVLALARLHHQGRRSLAASFALYDADGRELARAEDCRFSRFRTRDNLARQQHVHALVAVPARHPADDAPSGLLSPSGVATAVAPVLAALAADPDGRRRREEVLPFFTALMFSRLHQALSALAPSGGGLSPDRLVATGAVAQGLEPYLRYCLDLLAGMDLARRAGDQWTLAPCDLPPADTLWREAMAAYPAQAEELFVLARWSHDLDALLRDVSRGRELLDSKPGGALDRLARVAASRRDGREAVCAVLAALRADLPRGRPLRVLEVGAGSGALTQALLSRLTPGAFELLATDPDPEQVERLTVRFGGQPEFSAAVLDPADPVSDLVRPGAFDLVVSGFALAGADEPEAVLSALAGPLRPGGLLVVLEDAPHPVRHLLCGLDPDWWRDDGEGVFAPRLPEAGDWTGLLGGCGWEAPVCLAGLDADAEYVLTAARKPLPARPERPAPEPDARRFVLVAEAEPSPLAASLVGALAGRLAAAGRTPVLVTAGNDFEAGDGRYRLDPLDREHWTRLWAALGPAVPETPLEVVFLLGCDNRQDVSAAVFDALTTRSVAAAALLTAAWQDTAPAAGLCLVTGGGVPLAGQADRVVPSQGPLVGFGRVCVNEAPGLAVRLVDVQAGPDGGLPLEAAVREILCSPLARPRAPRDRETVLTPGGRYVLRLAHLEQLSRTDPLAGGETGPVALDLGTQGRLDAAVWRQVPERIPGPGQVRIDNRAAGVNYRDVMFTLGRIPEEALEAGAAGPTLGLECAGVVTAVGPGVTGVAPGDRVCCLAGGCYDSEVLAQAPCVFPLPESMTFAEGATIAVAHFTAYYALTHLARLAPGEKVLIHGAAGGVGLAAIQVARLCGAEVFATAGSPAKRQLLASLGVPHVFDSRSLDFADRVREATNGQGVDVVLNSIAGEALAKSLDVLRPLGRFLELGKVDFYANSPLRMRLLRHNISFFAIDMDEAVKQRPDVCRAVFLEMLGHFEARELSPLPHVIHPRSAVTEAFRAMQHAEHVGKLVIVPDRVPASVMAAPPPPLSGLSPEATYLVTGGLGGLGQVAVKRLIELGARQVVVASRSGAATEAGAAALAALSGQGARVTAVAVDLADPAAVDRVLAPALAALPPLAGIIHCAGVLRDAAIANLTPEAVSAVLRAKTLSAWNLHRLTAGTPLDFLVLFSSATTVLGNPGQANYVAANTGLEALAAYRRSLGLAAVSFGWGPVTDVGMLAARPDTLDSLSRLTGAVGLTASDALNFVETYAREARPNLHVFRMQLRKLGRLPYVSSPVYDYLTLDVVAEAGPGDGDDIRQTLRDMKPKEAVRHLAGILAQQFARILRLPASRIRHEVPLGELGMDSLMYVELGLATEETFGVDISSLSLSKSSTILSLAAMIHSQLRGEDAVEASEARRVADALRSQHGLALSEAATQRLIAESGGNGTPPTPRDI